MSLNTTESIKQLGFDADFFNLEELSIDSFLQSYLDEGNYRLAQWVGGDVLLQVINNELTEEETKKLTMAELQLAIVELLPIVWMQNKVQFESFEIEGAKIKLVVTNESERQSILESLLVKAERLCKSFMTIVEEGYVA